MCRPRPAEANTQVQLAIGNAITAKEFVAANRLRGWAWPGLSEMAPDARNRWMVARIHPRLLCLCAWYFEYCRVDDTHMHALHARVPSPADHRLAMFILRLEMLLRVNVFICTMHVWMYRFKSCATFL